MISLNIISPEEGNATRREEGGEKEEYIFKSSENAISITSIVLAYHLPALIGVTRARYLVITT
jgi:hypothetical protein